MNERHLIDALSRYGHFQNPDVLEVGEVARRDLAALTVDDRVVQAAIRSYQGMAGRVIDDLAFKHHGRPARRDGLAGPATYELLALPRCELPDYGPFSAAVGTGSWPQPCQKAGVKFHVNKSGMPSAIVAQWPDIMAKVVRAYGRMGLRLTEMDSADLANILISFSSFFGGTIGIAEFNSQSCSDRVTCRLSRSYVGHNVGLTKHEIGHCCNLSHTPGGTMNAWIQKELDENGLWVPADPSYARLVKFFGGEPVDSPDLPMPPPPDVPPPVPVPSPSPSPAPAPAPAPRRPLLDWLMKLFEGWF